MKVKKYLKFLVVGALFLPLVVFAEQHGRPTNNYTFSNVKLSQISPPPFVSTGNDGNAPYGSLENPRSPSDLPSSGGGQGSNAPLVPCNGIDCSIEKIKTMGVNIYNYFTGFGAILAVGAIVWGGFSYIMARGEPTKMAAAKQTVTNAIIGIVVLAASALIVNTVLNWAGKTGKVTKVEDVKAQ